MTQFTDAYACEGLKPRKTVVTKLKSWVHKGMALEGQNGLKIPYQISVYLRKNPINDNADDLYKCHTKIYAISGLPNINRKCQDYVYVK